MTPTPEVIVDEEERGFQVAMREVLWRELHSAVRAVLALDIEAMASTHGMSVEQFIADKSGRREAWLVSNTSAWARLRRLSKALDQPVLPHVPHTQQGL